MTPEVEELDCPRCGMKLTTADFQCPSCELLLDSPVLLERGFDEHVPSVIRTLLSPPQSGLHSFDPPRSNPATSTQEVQDGDGAWDDFGSTTKPMLYTEALADIPVVTPGLDLMQCRLSTLEAFVVSMVDAKTNVRALRQMASLTEPEFQAVLKTLRDRNVLQLVTPGAAPEIPINTPPPVTTPFDTEAPLQVPVEMDLQDLLVTAPETPHAQAFPPPPLQPVAPGMGAPPPRAVKPAMAVDPRRSGSSVPVPEVPRAVSLGSAAPPTPGALTPGRGGPSPTPAALPRTATPGVLPRTPTPGVLPRTPTPLSMPAVAPPNPEEVMAQLLAKQKPRGATKYEAVDPLQHAIALEQAGEVDKAIQVLEKAISRSKAPAAVYNRLGLVLLKERRDFAAAEKYIGKAQQLEPDNQVFQQNYVRVLHLSAASSGSRQVPKGVEETKSGLAGLVKSVFGKS